MRARKSWDLIPKPELIVRVTRAIDRRSEILPDRLGIELRVADLRLLCLQGRRAC
jgi:hypothetical protein